MENRWIRAEFDVTSGALVHLIDKRTNRDALTGPARAELMNIEHCDTWAHQVFRFDRSAGLFGGAQISVIERGPVRAGVRIVTRYGDSRMEQTFFLGAHDDQLVVAIRLNLREKHRMLKLCFPTEGTHDVSEIPYGVLERAGHGDEESCQRWVAVQGKSGGLAIVNDGKYSYSAPAGELRMTVSNTSAYADHFGQSRRDEFCQYMDQDEQRLTLAVVPYSGSWKTANLNRRAALVNQPMVHVVETYHAGPLKGEYRGIRIDADNVDIGALKRAEDDHGYVLRLAETVGERVRTPIDAALFSRKWVLELGAFEIKTFYLPDDPAAEVREVLLTELEEVPENR